MKSKKLSLNKKTVVNLGGKTMEAVYGGYEPTDICPSSPLACQSVLGCPYTDGCPPTELCLTDPFC